MTRAAAFWTAVEEADRRADRRLAAILRREPPARSAAQTPASVVWLLDCKPKRSDHRVKFFRDTDGLFARGPAKARFADQDQIATMQRLRADGMTFAGIARQMGCSVTTVRNRLKKTEHPIERKSAAAQRQAASISA